MILRDVIPQPSKSLDGAAVTEIDHHNIDVLDRIEPDPDLCDVRWWKLSIWLPYVCVDVTLKSRGHPLPSEYDMISFKLHRVKCMLNDSCDHIVSRSVLSGVSRYEETSLLFEGGMNCFRRASRTSGITDLIAQASRIPRLCETRNLTTLAGAKGRIPKRPRSVAQSLCLAEKICLS